LQHEHVGVVVGLRAAILVELGDHLGLVVRQVLRVQPRAAFDDRDLRAGGREVVGNDTAACA
jgi:hypothetical protein